jgi:acyl-CoA thioester hydrolase
MNKGHSDGNDTVHQTRLRVRLSETDQNGVVYYSQYFVYFDVAKTDFLTHEGMDPIGMGQSGLRLLAAETLCTYYAPAKFGDLLNIVVWVKKLGKTSVQFGFAVKRKKKQIAEGYILNVLVDESGKPVRLPRSARLKLARYVTLGR